MDTQDPLRERQRSGRGRPQGTAVLPVQSQQGGRALPRRPPIERSTPMTQVLLAYAAPVSVVLGMLGMAVAIRISRRPRFDLITEPIQLAMCTCTHPLSSHDRENDICH